MAIIKPLLKKLWASGGAIVQPSDTKIETGWTAEVPPHQWENFVQNRQDTYLAHINERGVPEWDGGTDYLADGKSYTQGSNGVIYKSVAASGPATTVQNPVTDVGVYWMVAFPSPSSVYSKVESDGKYLQKTSNLSDLSNTTTARSNLGVVAATETTAGLLEIATALEARSFTANKAIDGAKLAEAFKGSNYLLATSGYQKLPSGLIIQWGSSAPQLVNIVGNTSSTITFPIAFPTECLRVIASNDGSAWPLSNGVTARSNTVTLTNFVMYYQNTRDDQSVVGNWFAIGK